MFDKEDNVVLEAIQTVGSDSYAAIGVQGGTNVHEPNRDGDTMGSMARTFIKFDSVSGDSDIRVVIWNKDGQPQEFDDIAAISIAVGGGSECETMASGIATLAKLFNELGIQAADGQRSKIATSIAANKRISNEPVVS